MIKLAFIKSKECNLNNTYQRKHSWPKRRYVNSGLIAGKVGKLLEMFLKIKNKK